MELTVRNVRETMLDCLYQEGEDTSKSIIVEGIVQKFGFNPIKLEENKEKIESMLSQLPDPFQKNIGGGWSFLNACNNKENFQWADEHRDMESLMCLGIGIGKVEYQLPRNHWASLPGGMPYFSVNVK